jgi:hypothetical protein
VRLFCWPDILVSQSALFPYVPRPSGNERGQGNIISAACKWQGSQKGERLRMKQYWINEEDLLLW